MAVGGPPHTETLLAAAGQLDRAWDAWATAEDGDPEFAAVEEAMGSLRRALNGTRRLRLNKDGYGFWRPKCSCGWPGSPWDYRSDAVAEFSKHLCDQGD